MISRRRLFSFMAGAAAAPAVDMCRALSAPNDFIEIAHVREITPMDWLQESNVLEIDNCLERLAR